jgi:hypothetical protein
MEVMDLRLRIQGLGCWVEDVWFRSKVSELRVLSFGLKFQVFGFRV